MSRVEKEAAKGPPRSFPTNVAGQMKASQEQMAEGARAAAENARRLPGVEQTERLWMNVKKRLMIRPNVSWWPSVNLKQAEMPTLLPIMLQFGALVTMLLALVSAMWLVPQGMILNITTSPSPTPVGPPGSTPILASLTTPFAIQRAGLWRACSLFDTGDFLRTVVAVPSPAPPGSAPISSTYALPTPTLSATLRRDFYAASHGEDTNAEWHFGVGVPTTAAQVESCGGAKLEFYKDIHGYDAMPLVQATRAFTIISLILGALVVWPYVFDLCMAIGGACRGRTPPHARPNRAGSRMQPPGSPLQHPGARRPPLRDIAAALWLSQLTGGAFQFACMLLPLALFGAIFSYCEHRAPYNAEYSQFIGPAYWLWMGATLMHIMAYLINIIVIQVRPFPASTFADAAAPTPPPLSPPPQVGAVGEEDREAFEAMEKGTAGPGPAAAPPGVGEPAAAGGFEQVEFRRT